jgi:hypothetical protein
MTDSEKDKFISALVRRGWLLQEATIWAPSKGLWFDDSHFRGWSLEDFAAIFARRAQRIAESKLTPTWENSFRENRQVSEAAKEVME